MRSGGFIPLIKIVLKAALLSVLLCCTHASGQPIGFPTIEIGADRTVAVGEPLRLTATLTDDGPLSALTVNWYQVNGPSSNIDFESVSATSETLTFHETGTYTIGAGVFDGGGLYDFDSLTVTVGLASSLGTSLSITGDTGSAYPGSKFYDEGAGSFHASYGVDGSIFVSYFSNYTPSEPTTLWYLSFAAPLGPLTPGVYTDAKFSGRTLTTPYLGVIGSTIRAGDIGQFEIKKIVYGHGDVVEGLWATFEVHREGETAAVRGEIRFNANTTATTVNLPPGVYVGPDQRTLPGRPVSLTGGIADDHLPSPAALTATWKVFDGPGDVVFEDEHATATTATFSTPGTYVLLLLASDGELESSGQMNVTVIDSQEQTSISLTSEEGDPIGQGRTLYRDLLSGTMQGYAPSDGGYYGDRGTTLNFVSATDDEGWDVSFRGPLGAALHVGRYEAAENYEFGKGFPPQMNFAGMGLGEGPFTGWFEVKKVSYRDAYFLNELWVVFEVHAAGVAAAFRGEVKFHAEANTPSANFPPAVHAGAAQRAFVLGATALHGYAEDDHLPSGLPTTRWTVESGPGSVVFVDDSALVTTATFSTPGVYTLRLTASDGLKEEQSKVNITVVELADKTSLRIESEGEAHTYTLLDGDFQVGTSSYGGFVIRMLSPDENQVLPAAEFVPPSGQQLHPGIYAHATIVPYYPLPTERAALSISGGPVSGRGSFAVREIQYDANGNLTSFWATFTEEANFNHPSALTGEIRYHAHPDLPQEDLVPAADAGQDFTIDRPGPARLTGAAADDFILGGVLPVEWSKVSGPGEVTFADPHAATTTATLSEPGTYVLRLSTSDGTHSASDDVTVVQATLETSFRVHVESAEGTTDHFYTQADGVFDAFYANFGFTGFSFGFHSVDAFPAHGWSGSFRPRPGESVDTELYQQVEKRTTEGPLSGHIAALLSSSEPGFQVDLEPSDGTSVVDIKSLVVHHDGTVANCWFTFTIKSDDAVVTGEFRYHTNLNAAPRIALPRTLHVFTDSVHLDALVTDDGLPAGSGVSVQWVTFYPESQVTIDTPETASTEVHFGGSNSYFLRVTATDGDQISSREITVHTAPAEGSWSGLVHLPGRADGFLQFQRTATGLFTGSLRAGPRKIPLRGTLNSEGPTVIPFLLDGSSCELTVLPGGNGYVEATLDLDGTRKTTLLSYTAPDRSLSADLPLRNGFIFQDPTDSPGGIVPRSWGRATVRKNGSVSLVVSLIDGTRASGSATLMSDTSLSAFLPLGRTRHWFALNATYHPDDEIWFGSAHWTRQRTARRPAIDFDLDATGGAVATFNHRTEPLNGGTTPVSAYLVLSVPRLQTLTLTMLVGPGGRVTRLRTDEGNPIAANLAFYPGGVFTGQVFHPVHHRMIKFSGIVTEDSQLASGFALCNGVAGEASLVWEGPDFAANEKRRTGEPTVQKDMRKGP